MKYSYCAIMILLLISCFQPDKNRTYITPVELKKAIASELKKSEVDLNKMLDFIYQYYDNFNIKNADKSIDDDMLLFQYGFYETDGKQYFEVDITRQYMKKIFFLGEIYMQLHFTAYYDPQIVKKDIESFDLWLNSKINKEDWLNKVKNSIGFQEALKVKPLNYYIYKDFTD